MNRTKVFRFRITPAEVRRLDRRSEKEGLSKADVIRKSLGWGLHEEPPAPPGEVAQKVVEQAAARKTPADAEAEPGVAALQQVADRIAGKG